LVPLGPDGGDGLAEDNGVAEVEDALGSASAGVLSYRSSCVHHGISAGNNLALLSNDAWKRDEFRW
jgi:hypothetical protein